MIKKILILGLSCIFITGSMISCNSKNKKSEKETTGTISQKPADKKFVELAEQTNKQLPMSIGMGITLEKAEAVSDKEFKFYYKLANKPNMSPDEFVKNSKAPVIAALKAANTPDIKLFAENKMTLVYEYATHEGVFAEIRVAPEEYAK